MTRELLLMLLALCIEGKIRKGVIKTGISIWPRKSFKTKTGNFSVCSTVDSLIMDIGPAT